MIAEVGAGLRSYTLRRRRRDRALRRGRAAAEVRAARCSCRGRTGIRGGRYPFDGVDAPARAHRTGHRQRHPRLRPLGALDAGCSIAPTAVTLRSTSCRRTGCPFEVRVEVTYALHARRPVGHAHGRQPRRRAAPFGAGFHPYLSTRGHASPTSPCSCPPATGCSTRRRGSPDRAADGGEDRRTTCAVGASCATLRLDDAFTVSTSCDGRGIAEVRTGDGGAQLWFDEAFGYLQVFTQADVTARPAPGWPSSR